MCSCVVRFLACSGSVLYCAVAAQFCLLLCCIVFTAVLRCVHCWVVFCVLLCCDVYTAMLCCAVCVVS